jgi:hypothetical protein
MIGTTSQFGSAITCIDAGDSKNGLAINQDHAGGGFTPVLIDRTASDGTLIAFDRNGTSVGSIGSKSGSLLIGSTDTYLRVNDPSDTIFPSNSSGAERDNTINLGKGSSRFKDLYLSGGVDFGGAVNSGGVTSSSNKLEDYEEGTWTPNIIGSTSGGWTSRTGYTQGFYTKIGSYVHVDVRFESTSRNSPVGYLTISGFPFAAAASTSTIRNQYQIYTLFRGINPSSDSMGHIAILSEDDSYCTIYERRNNSAFSLDVVNVSSVPGQCEGCIHFSYRTTS